jgi:hypothetical protein
MTSSTIPWQTKWEYQSLTRVSEAAMIEALNQLGQESWELVSASHYRDMAGMTAWTAILKRPVAGESARPVRGEASIAPMATPPTPRPAPAPTGPEAAEEDTEFEINVPASAPPRRPTSPKASRSAPAKPRVPISDDFDFELPETALAGEPKRQAKAKSAVAEAELDFELGDTFPAKLQTSKPSPPKPKEEAASDDTDFDLG